MSQEVEQAPAPGVPGPGHHQLLARPIARILAFAVDYLVIAGYIVAISGISFALRLAPLGTAFTRLGTSPLSGQLTAFLMLTLPVVPYFPLLEGSPLGATIGKRVLGLRVVATDNQQLPARRSLGRSVAKFLSWKIAHTCLWRINGWPIAPEPPSFAIWTGFATVGVLVALYLGSLGAARARPPTIASRARLWYRTRRMTLQA